MRRDAFELLLLMVETIQTNADDQIVQFSQAINIEPFHRFVVYNCLVQFLVFQRTDPFTYSYLLGLQMILIRIKRKWHLRVRIPRQEST